MAVPQANIGSARLDNAIDSALDWLDASQHDEGYWVGMLESNSCMEAEWLMAFHVLGVHFPATDAVARAILAKQRPDGAWDTFYDAPSGDINTTVECYTALRVAGFPPSAPQLRKARSWIHAHGGLKHIRVFTRYWLALLGEWPWEHTPNMPPEIIAMPRWAPFNIYNFASWARATLVPISVLSAKRFTRPLAVSQRLDELFPNGRDAFEYALPKLKRGWSWESVFLTADRCLHTLQGWHVTPGRDRAIRRCVEWILGHQDADGAWGGIQPPWVYSLMALYAAGYPPDHPAIARGLAALNGHWSYERGGARFIQASESPVWDTLLVLMAMQDCHRDWRDHAGMRRAVEWLMARECGSRGDWSHTVHDAEPGGWAFERANRHYPDIDDTAVAMIVLGSIARDGGDTAIGAAVQRARAWTIAMQSDNGGWAAFDRNNHHALVTKIPFCDFGEVLDPPSSDVTAHVVEALAGLGMGRDDMPMARALDYLRREQEADGSWFGRWGVNHIYGTAAVLPALRAAGEDMNRRYIARAGDWLLARQNADGGWGETCSSYMDPRLAGVGPSTASQTAWALIALLAVNDRRYVGSIRHGMEYLLRQQADGTWEEPQYTGAGFPGYGVGARLGCKSQLPELGLRQGPELARAFMINYNLYRHYFPLMALARVRDRIGP